MASPSSVLVTLHGKPATWKALNKLSAFTFPAYTFFTGEAIEASVPDERRVSGRIGYNRGFIMHPKRTQKPAESEKQLKQKITSGNTRYFLERNEEFHRSFSAQKVPRKFVTKARQQNIGLEYLNPDYKELISPHSDTPLITPEDQIESPPYH